LSCTYLAHHELESVKSIIVIIDRRTLAYGDKLHICVMSAWLQDTILQATLSTLMMFEAIKHVDVLNWKGDFER